MRAERLIPLLLLGACGGGVAPAPASPAPRTAPPGVDSAVAAHADSVARLALVSEASDARAAELQGSGVALVAHIDTLWMAADAVRLPSAADSAAAQTLTLQGGQVLVALDSTLRTAALPLEELRRRTARLLDSAEVLLQAAWELNPFDQRSRLWLARVYELQARRLGQESAYERALAVLERLAQLTPDQHGVFAMQANMHVQLGRWDDAAAGYERAARVYEATWDLVPEAPAMLDSSVLYEYARAEADMHIRRLDAARARTAFERALRFARTEADTMFVHGELAWMAWDDGRIASALARDSLAALEQSGDLDGARRGYAVLLPGLTAGRAIDETEWRLAVVDYNRGDAAAAAARLQALAARTPVDRAGVPLDSTGQRYLDDYGTISLNLARDHLVTQRDSRTALMYFEQATRIPWSGRSVAHLEAAALLQNRPETALEHARAALAAESGLDVDQRLELYRLLTSLYRRVGAFEEARAFRDRYRALQGN